MGSFISGNLIMEIIIVYILGPVRPAREADEQDIRAHPVFAPVAWLTAFVFGAAFWVGFLYLIFQSG
jgi:hypothetical protein